MVIKYKNLLSLILFISYFSINGLPLNPVYLIALLLILLYILILFTKNNLKVSHFELFIYILVLLLAASQFVGLRKTLSSFGEANYLSVLLLLYSLLMAGITSSIASKVNQQDRLTAYSKTLSYLCIFLCVETFTRFTIFKGSSNSIYAFKESFFYFDSNFTGLVVLNFLFFFYYLEVRKSFNFSLFYKILLWSLLILTFSRASIAAGVVLYILLLTSGRLRNILITLSGLVGSYLLLTLYSYYSTGGSFLNIDGSLNSKFYIINIFINFYNNLTITEKLFGVGIGNASGFLGVFAHNIIVTFLAELGILGTTLILIFFYYSLLKSKYYTFFIVLPTIVAGMSLFSAYSPFVFVLIALIIIEEKSVVVQKVG